MVHAVPVVRNKGNSDICCCILVQQHSRGAEGPEYRVAEQLAVISDFFFCIQVAVSVSVLVWCGGD